MNLDTPHSHVQQEPTMQETELPNPILKEFRKKARETPFGDAQWRDVSWNPSNGRVRLIHDIPIDALTSKQLRTVCSRLKVRRVTNAKKAVMLAALHQLNRRRLGMKQDQTLYVPQQAAAPPPNGTSNEVPEWVVLQDKSDNQSSDDALTNGDMSSDESSPDESQEGDTHSIKTLMGFFFMIQTRRILDSFDFSNLLEFDELSTLDSSTTDSTLSTMDSTLSTTDTTLSTTDSTTTDSTDGLVVADFDCMHIDNLLDLMAIIEESIGSIQDCTEYLRPLLINIKNQTLELREKQRERKRRAREFQEQKKERKRKAKIRRSLSDQFDKVAAAYQSPPDGRKGN